MHGAALCARTSFSSLDHFPRENGRGDRIASAHRRCAHLQKCSSAFLMERERDARTSCALELRSHP